ncbi:molybdopterin-dependent oxidoreductase [Frondihabitans cladoniiphilus]|uniref:Molybdopterin-dependent oxidoreductase n=1 Tax=Frondihabitans cladoniiphilus TaxID=715785 RepID=A0ABP8WA02_9MICO
MSLRAAPPKAPSPTPSSPVALPPRVARAYAALTGLIGIAVFLASAEIVALFVGAPSSPLFAVGSAAIDFAPHGVKQIMVDLFSTGDKAALFVLMGVILVVICALAGIVEWKKSPWGRAIFLLGAALAAAAVLTRSGNGVIAVAPTVVGLVVTLLVFRRLIVRLLRWEASTAGVEFPTAFVPPMQTPVIERRAFLRFAIVAGAASAVLGTGARLINATAVNAVALRAALKLPKAAVAEKAVPAGASLDVEGITPYVVSNADFYRIDTALTVPQIDPAKWTLKITGMVENPVEISFDELMKLPLVEHMATLSCVSNDVGGNLIGNALWLGYPIRDLLARAKPTAGADMVLSRSQDGFSAGTPLDVLQDEGTQALLAVGMNGVPLPLEHGFPVRMVVPGLFGYVSATKWVVSMEVTRFDKAEGYWTPRGWSERGPVKLESRIDTPSNGYSVPAGVVPVAGVAWEPHTGVSKVELKIDKDDWVEATLADSVSADTWRQWVYRWDAPKGSHTIQVRATSATGKVQPSTYRPPAPNGAEGWDQITVTVT